nr:MAG TPA: tail protein [Caudoviricetes sp.]
MAYPILYKANETNFEHLGVSVLSDASKCYVSREKNGIYILEFDYPVNGKDVEKIKEGMYIKSDAGYRTKKQRFVISKITKTQNEFKIYCQHISQVKTTMNAIRPDITLTNVSAMGALTAWRDNLLDSREEFFVQSDIGTLNSTTWKVENIENARDALGGKAGSILDVWGGEYEFDNLNITLHKSMGIDNPTIIAYGKNLLDLEQEQSILETYTSVFPFKKYTDDNNREQLITLPEILLDSTHLNKFTHRRILKVDFSSDENLKTVEQLRSKAKSYIKNNNVGVPKTNLKINYQDLSKVEGVFDNPALEQIDLCDRLKVYYSELGILNENAKVVKVIWDVILEENHEIEVGDGRSSFTDSTSAKIETLQAQNDSVIARINALVAEQDAAFDRFFKEKSKVIEDVVKTGTEKAQLSSEEKLRKMGEAFDEKVNQFRDQVSTTVENYNRQFQATNLEISKNRVEATKQIQALSDRVSNIQDISNNETVVELRGLVNGATSKVTELETSITREFTAVKKKNEDSLNAVKAEFTKGVDGLTSKITSLEEYKNQDGSRTENLKQWVQRDTASQLSRERTEINRIIDNKGFVKNAEFSSKFTESARGITNQLTALENYKNQDGARTANLQIWAQNNTANQLTAARRSIESWVNEKGYATTSVVENKVQETANSFSREISNVREVIKDKVLSNDNLLLGTREFISKHFAPATPWQRPLVWENETERYNDFAVKSTIYHLNGLWQDVAVEKGKTYEYGFFVKGSRYTNKIIFSPGWPSNDAKRPLAEYNVRDTEFTLTTNWKFHSFRFTVTSSGWSQCRVEKTEENNGIKLSICGLYLREVKNNETSPLGWKPAFEDEQLSINELNTWKQTATETLNTVSSGLNDTVKHSQLRIGADGIDFGSKKVFNGRNLASILSVSPESIKAITDKLVITPANENLAKIEYRNEVTFNKRDLYLNKITDSNKAGDEYYFSVKARQVSGSNGYKDLNAMVHVKYKDGTDDWLSTVLYPASGYGVRDCTATIKIPDKNKEIDFIEPILQQNTWSNYTTYSINKLTVVKKKSAELIVDGSIEGRQIKTNTLETGHHKAGSITSEIIAANAVKAKHVEIDDGLIDNLVSHKAFITKLWAKDAFIKSLQTVKIKSTQIDADLLSAYTGKIGNFNIGQHWGGSGQWITGLNNFSVGMSDGSWDRTALWVNWGDKWETPGNKAWFVTPDGRMRCYNKAEFWNEPVVYGNLKVTGDIIYNNGKWCYSKIYTELGKADGNSSRLFLRGNNGLYDYIVIDSLVSDRRLKSNIKKSTVNALEVLNKFETYSFTRKYREDVKNIELGIMAQDVKEYMHDAFVEHPAGYYTYEPFEMIPYLIKAIQELSEENKILKQQIGGINKWITNYNQSI